MVTMLLLTLALNRIWSSALSILAEEGAAADHFQHDQFSVLQSPLISVDLVDLWHRVQETRVGC